MLEVFVFTLLIVGLALFYLGPIALDLWGLYRPLPSRPEPQPDPGDTKGACFSEEAIAFVMKERHRA